jgi:hypothetical protein
MLLAALAAAFAWSVSSRYLAGEPPLLRAVAGSLLVTAAYAALAATSGRGRGWLAALRATAHGP